MPSGARARAACSRVVATSVASPCASDEHTDALHCTHSARSLLNPRPPAYNPEYSSIAASQTEAPSTVAAGSSDPALAATTSTLAASDCAFRRLGDVRRALSASSMGSFILIALVVTVQTAQHGLAVLLSVGPSGVDLPGAAYAPESRDSMLKRVEKQSNAFLGAESATFLACEDANDSHTLRCYACPYELDAFLALKTGAQWVADTTALKQCTYDKDNPAHQLIFAPVSALRDLSCERLCLEAMSAVDTMRSSACVPLDLAPLETQNGGDSSPGTTKPRETTSAAWTLRMRQHEASQKLVRLQLRVAARRQHQRGLEADADELVASADRVGNNKVTDINAIPLELRGHDDAIANDKWRHARFSPVLEAPVTNALLKPTPQPQITWRPATIEDLFMPGVWAKVAAWCEGNAKDLLWMREHGADGKKTSQAATASSCAVRLGSRGAWRGVGPTPCQ